MAEAFEYQDVIYTVVFLIVVFFMGKAAEVARMPAIVGEIVAGMLLGPHVLDFVPDHDENNYQVRAVAALQLFGEIGLLLMVIEAGLEVELHVLRQIGLRGLLIGIVGSFLPLAIGFLIAHFGFGFGWQSAIAAGAVLSPTSMGIALVVLKQGRVLNTPTGQLVVASAVIDDVIALVILSLLKALVEPSVMAFVIPIVSALAFTVGVGAFGVWVMPFLISRVYLKYMPTRYVEDGLITLILLCAVGLSAALHYGKASYLFGAFLAGLCFCTAHSVEVIWARQVKRLLRWLLRLFFACTVGFSIPAREFAKAKVVGMGFAFFCAIVGKLAMGLFAYPLTSFSFFLVGFAMSAWGEFAFIVAGAAHAMQLLDDDLYSALLFAVLLSVIVGPYALRITLLTHEHSRKMELQSAKDAMERSLKRESLESAGPVGDAAPAEERRDKGLRRKSIVFIDTTDEEGVSRSVQKRRTTKRVEEGRELAEEGEESEPCAIFYKLDVRTKLSWGLMSRLLHTIADLGLEVVEFRADTSADGKEALYEAFLKDTVLKDLNPHTPEAEGLIDRLHALRERILETIRASDPEAVDAHAQHLIAGTQLTEAESLHEEDQVARCDGHDVGPEGGRGGDSASSSSNTTGADDDDEYVLESTDEAVAVVVHSGGKGEPSLQSHAGGGHVLILDGSVDYSRLRGLHLVRWLPGVDTTQWLEFGTDDALAHEIVTHHIGRGVLATLHHHHRHHSHLPTELERASSDALDAQIYKALEEQDRLHAAEKLRTDPHGLRRSRDAVPGTLSSTMSRAASMSRLASASSS